MAKIDANTNVNDAMNIIEIEVGDSKYKISCKNDEEQHIIALSKKLDNRINELSNSLNNKANNSLLLIINSIMMQDEIDNLKASNLAQKEQANNNSYKKIAEESIKTIDDIMAQLKAVAIKRSSM